MNDYSKPQLEDMPEFRAWRLLKRAERGDLDGSGRFSYAEAGARIHFIWLTVIRSL